MDPAVKPRDDISWWRDDIPDVQDGISWLRDNIPGVQVSIPDARDDG